MDIFRILSRGASLKKDKSITTDYAQPSKKQVNLEHAKQESMAHTVAKETDFFHTSKHSVPETAKAKVSVEPEETVEDQIPLKISNLEDAARLRKINAAKVSGSDLPLPIGSFNDLVGRYKLDKKLLLNLLEAGFVEPTAVQCESIPVSLDLRDLIACAPTGSGKTLAFLIPLVQKILDSTEPNSKNSGIKGLVISPTNELAVQTFEELQTLCRGKSLTIGVLSKQLASKINHKVINSAKYDILISTPLRLIDAVKQGNAALSKVSHLVIDEADKLFDQGFVEQTDDILSHCTNPAITKAMFSATIPSGVEEMAQLIMPDPIRVIIGHKEAASSTIDQRLVFTGNEEGKLLAIRQMIQEGEFKPPIIIFLQSISRAKALFHELLYDKLNVDVIHAERSPKQRDEVIRRFKNGDVWVLITTDVIARGVDFKGVNMVINYDVPQTAQAYVHRIGRTGRGGKLGKAVTLFTKEDNIAIKPIINVMKQSGCESGFSKWLGDAGKLSRADKNTMRHEIKRKQISTVPKVVKEKRKRRDEMIDASKRRKEQDSNGD